MILRPLLLLSAAGLLALPSLADAGEAHVHGVAKLDIAIEAEKLTVLLESPLDNLLGFERAPRSAAEQRLAKALVARLEAGKPFQIDPRGGCSLDKVTLSSAALGLGAEKTSDADHADVDGSFEFKCADATKAAYLDVDLYGQREMQRIEIQVAGPAGQFKRQLARPAKRIQLIR